MPTPEQIEEDAKLTPEERAQKLAEAKRAYEAVEPAPRSELHTYPDGSQRVGTPPFPELSPIQEAEAKLERVGAPPAAPMQPPPGMPTSGAAVPASPVGITTEQLAAKAQEQLDSDVMSGKSPNTPNPTTDSNKPELAGTAGDLPPAEPTPEELEAIAASIQPSAEGATAEQAEAAVTQVLRETKGPIVDEPAEEKKPAAKKKG